MSALRCSATERGYSILCGARMKVAWRALANVSTFDVAEKKENSEAWSCYWRAYWLVGWLQTLSSCAVYQLGLSGRWETRHEITKRDKATIAGCALGERATPEWQCGRSDVASLYLW